MKRITLATTAVILLFTFQLVFTVPVYAKKETKTGDLHSMFVATGEGEQVALFRAGKKIWQPAVDVIPDSYYADLGALPWTGVEGAAWITYNFEVSAPSENCWYVYEKSFDIPGEVVGASMVITADNAYMIHVNGRLVGRDGNLFQPTPVTDMFNWQEPETYDLAKALRQGMNNVVVYVRNYGMTDGTWWSNPTGLVFSITIDYLA